MSKTINKWYHPIENTDLVLVTQDVAGPGLVLRYQYLCRSTDESLMTLHWSLITLDMDVLVESTPMCADMLELTKEIALTKWEHYLVSELNKLKVSEHLRKKDEQN